MSIWKLLPAELAHSLAPWGLTLYSSFMRDSTPKWQEFKWQSLVFPNRLGIAAGIDKNAEKILDWQSVGAGFIEIGTVTPTAQVANAGRIIDRNWKQKLLWNKMGFPNQGAEEVYYNLLHSLGELEIPVFVSIGKNRDTPAEDAAKDYANLTQRFATKASALVINVSSPNTQGLRDLQTKAELLNILNTVVPLAKNTPVIVKLSPDLTESQLKEAIEACLEGGGKGIIISNTTTSRPTNSDLPKEGGLSGLFLAELAKKKLQMTLKILGPQKKNFLVISSGGVMTPKDVEERIQMGADLVQVYSALVFHGPGFFRKTADWMLRGKNR